MSDDPQVRRLVAQMPDFWHAEAKSMVARHIVSTNRNHGMALDARPRSLDDDINRFFRGDPMTTAPSAAMPATFSDNYVGGAEYRRRNNGADQGSSVQELLQVVGNTLQTLSQLEIDQFITGLNHMLGGSAMPGEDQGSSMRLPDNGGSGVAPGEFFEGQTTEGTFSERDPVGTGPRGTADSRPRTMRDRRRMGADRHMAQDADIRQRYANQSSFLERFPMAARIQVWG